MKITCASNSVRPTPLRPFKKANFNINLINLLWRIEVHFTFPVFRYSGLENRD
jgi:hypothetical protein